MLTGFGGFRGAARVARDDDDGSLPPEATFELRRLAKKDATTKLKALARLTELAESGDEALRAALLPPWLTTLLRLCCDGSRLVRAATAVLCGRLAVLCGRRLGAHAKPLITSWFPLTLDPEPEVASAAGASFASAFPGAKAGAAVGVCRASLEAGALSALRCSSPSQLPDPGGDGDADGADRLTRWHAVGLKTLAVLAALPQTPPPDDASQQPFDSRALPAALPCLSSPSPVVRGAAFELVRACATAPGAPDRPPLRDAAPAALKASLSEREAVHSALSCAVAVGGAVPSAWESVSATSVATLFADDASRAALFALQLLACQPAGVFEATAAGAVAALWGARASAPGAQAKAAIADAAASCAVYTVLRLGDGGDGASEAQAGAVNALLLDCPLASALSRDASAPPADRAACASVFASAAARLSAKQSLREAARSVLWGGAAAAVIAALDSAAASTGVAPLLAALHAANSPHVDDLFVAPLRRKLRSALAASCAPRESDAPPSVVASVFAASLLVTLWGADEAGGGGGSSHALSPASLAASLASLPPPHVAAADAAIASLLSSLPAPDGSLLASLRDSSLSAALASLASAAPSRPPGWMAAWGGGGVDARVRGAAASRDWATLHRLISTHSLLSPPAVDDAVDALCAAVAGAATRDAAAGWCASLLCGLLPRNRPNAALRVAAALFGAALASGALSGEQADAEAVVEEEEAQVAIDAPPLAAWRSVCAAPARPLAALPAPGVAESLGASLRAFAASSEGWGAPQEASVAAAIRLASSALSPACSSQLIDVAIAPGGGWCDEPQAPPAGGDGADASPPRPWPRRAATLLATLCASLPPPSPLFGRHAAAVALLRSGGGESSRAALSAALDSPSPPAVQLAEALADAVLRRSAAAPGDVASSAAVSECFALLSASPAFSTSAALRVFEAHVAPALSAEPGGGGGGGARACAGVVLRCMRAGGTETAARARDATLAACRRAEERASRRRSGAGGALEAAALCFPPDSQPSPPETEALVAAWRGVARGDAGGAAAAAAARRAGGGDAAATACDGGDDSLERGIAALAAPLLRLSWAALGPEDWALLGARLHGWMGRPSLRCSAAALLSSIDALPLAVSESVDGAGGDVVPYTSGGEGARSAASAMARAGWPAARSNAIQAAARAVMAAGAGGTRDGAWEAAASLLLCHPSPVPSDALRRAAADADAAPPGAIACLYALLRDEADAGGSPTAGACAAHALLLHPALRAAAALGLDAPVADTEALLAAHAAAEEERGGAGGVSGGEGGDSAQSSPYPASQLGALLAAADAAALRSPLAALLGAHPTSLRAWAVLLNGALFCSPSQAGRVRTFVASTSSLPTILTAASRVLPPPPAKPRGGAQKSGGGGGGMARVPPLWAAAATPSSALRASASAPAPEVLAALFGAALRAFPAVVREWFASLRDASTAAAVEAGVAAHISPGLVAAEVAAAAAMAAPEGLKVRAAPGGGGLRASYAVDDALLEVSLSLPPSYPLRVATAACDKRVGVSEARLRTWLLAMAASLRTSQGGGVEAALTHWAACCAKEFSGVEPCPICYMTVHAGTQKLPRLACKQCRNKFHAGACGAAAACSPTVAAHAPPHQRACTIGSSPPTRAHAPSAKQRGVTPCRDGVHTGGQLRAHATLHQSAMLGTRASVQDFHPPFLRPGADVRM